MSESEIRYERTIDGAVKRGGRFKAMLIWMAQENRLNEFELNMLINELSLNVFESDMAEVEKLNKLKK